MDMENKPEEILDREKLPPHPPGRVSILAFISYLGPLVVISYWFNKNNEFIKFHTKQGYIIFGIEVLTLLLSSILMLGNFLFNVFYIVCVLYSAIGIWNVVHKRLKELPIIGKYSTIFNF